RRDGTARTASQVRRDGYGCARTQWFRPPAQLAGGTCALCAVLPASRSLLKFNGLEETARCDWPRPPDCATMIFKKAGSSSSLSILRVARFTPSGKFIQDKFFGSEHNYWR